MPSHFIGELSKTRLFDLIKPLLDGKKSGMISVKGKDAGEIHIEGGQIIHAQTGYLTGEEAILTMMEWEVGRVSFDWEVTTAERTTSLPTEQLLIILSTREEEWRGIREVVPSPGSAYRIAMQGDSEDKSIQGDHWKVLALSNGSRRVSDIAEALKWDLFRTSRTICAMVQAGLLERASVGTVEELRPQPKRYVNGNFFPVVETELKRLMGPIAPIIIEDVLAELGESKESFPHEQIERFLQAIVGEISDMTKRVAFNKVINEVLSLEEGYKS
jgi:hypothetical protein